jgi:glutathione S-transferase
MSRPILHIGNKNYSSWSMRPWLALKWAGVAFDEHVVPLGPRDGGINPDIAAVSPSGRVPALEVDGAVIVESLAICEWAADVAPHAGLWPEDPLERAVARAAASEMHAGFAALRRDLPMNLRRRKDAHTWSQAAATDIERVQKLFEDLSARFGDRGPWLCGRRGIVDAMYAPVATRFATYGVPLRPVTQAWCEILFADPGFRSWEQAALAETWTIAETDIV